ncbi:helix-turn-helix domain-containing protein [Neochlamydia sp. S13]|uniref:helix-turn-helix domain-containing protein n=1 Tax=Neochlamydia sp. S13 TaxID=1353976 RepID=UPI000FD1796A|nr:helix-turn-helix domain-containing protein [Neochlamydia sp. S13]BBI17921.1 MtN3 and saliva related transmembrane protein [Neochlamydia sp. S13]
MFVAFYHTIEELNAMAKKKAYGSYSCKLRAVVMEGESAYQIGKALGYCTSAIQKWIRRYNGSSIFFIRLKCLIILLLKLYGFFIKFCSHQNFN